MYSKISVAGDDQHPLYAALIAAQPTATGEGPFRERLAGKNLGGAAPGILWNFEKFVVGRNGQVVARFSPDVAADDPRLVSVLEAELAKAA
jgi:glutathione peroxidase